MKATTGAIWKAAARDQSSQVLTAVRFDAENGTLSATNTYIAARVPCEVEKGDESGLIPAAALEQAKQKSLRVSGGKATLKVDGGERSWNLIAGVFPDIDKIIDGAPKIDSPFGLNARLLDDLQRAIRSGEHDPAILHPVHPHKGILVGSAHGGVGVVMPIRLGDYPAPSTNGKPDIDDDDAVIAAVIAAHRALKSRRGRRRAAQEFRVALADAHSESK